MIYNNTTELIKSNCPNLPALIPAYNNPSYTENMIRQLNEYGFNNKDIIILDNFSKSPAMQDTLRKLDKLGCRVVRKFTNDGPREYYLNKKLFDWLPELFILTDPDIEFNSSLPKDFVQTLINVSKEYELYKVGFALDIEMDGIESSIKEINFSPQLTMYQWETQFWQDLIDVTGDGHPIYRAAIDTTFCLVNKSFFEYYSEPMQIGRRCARIGGDFTAQHYGWYENPPISEDEYEYYLSKVPPQWSFSSNEIKRKRGL